MHSRARNVAIGSIAISSVSLGSYITLPVYLVPLTELLNVSIAQAALLFTCTAIGGLITSLLFGRLLKMLKVRTLVSTSGVALTLFFCSIFYGESITLIYLASILFGFSTIFAGFAIAQTEITWWFVKGRAKMMSFLNVGLGLFGLIFVPVIAKVIESYGVQNIALFQGVIGGGLIIVMALFLISEHPDRYGLSPVGFAQQANQSVMTNDYVESHLSVKEITKMPAFWMIIVSIILVSIAVTGFMNNGSAFYQSIGLDAMAAALCISIFNGVQLMWVPIYGLLVDKMGPGFATAIYGLAGAVVFFVAIFLTGFSGAVMIAALLSVLNVAGMIGAVSFPSIFGTKEAGSLIGFANAAGNIGGMIGAPLAGIIFDATGSYHLFLAAAGAACIITVILTLKGTGKKAIASVQLKEAQLTETELPLKQKAL
ncbi:MFS transporter [Bacillus benzoevorans]|uniref:MFS family permease n=1 Tax=Bacillus benzoevorans TaxID=1456 RepID=A0A7X0HWW1_9BACI|nr:MFS transporter [Bacillus benzoevorans]MBB6447095.1 MFS family permease [Bacillus benzoevorans]